MGNDDQLKEVTKEKEKEKEIKVRQNNEGSMPSSSVVADKNQIPGNVINVPKKEVKNTNRINDKRNPVSDDTKLSKEAIESINKSIKYDNDNNKYYLAGSANAPKTVYLLEKNSDSFAKHEKDLVELDVDPKSLSEQELLSEWEDKLGDQFQGRIPDREKIIEYRNLQFEKLGVSEEMKKTMIAGDYTGATFSLLAQKQAFGVYELTRKTLLYWGVVEEKDRLKKQVLQNTKRDKTHGTTHIKEEESINGSRYFNYPAQDYSNCYACAGSAAFNRLIKGDKSAVKLDQYKVRGFVPKYLNAQEVAKFNEANVDENVWEQQVDEISEFAGPKKLKFGNFFSVSDVIHDKIENGGCGRKDIAVHKMVFQLNNCSDTQAENQIQVLKQKLHNILGEGQMAVLGFHSHYLTITGLDEDNIYYLDSISGEVPRDTNKELSMDIHDFLKKQGHAQSYDTTELTWMTKISDESKEQLMKEYTDLSVDEVTGELSRKNKKNIGADDVSHRAGIVIQKTEEKLNKEGYEDVSDCIAEFVALHRYAFGGAPIEEQIPDPLVIQNNEQEQEKEIEKEKEKEEEKDKEKEKEEADKKAEQEKARQELIAAQEKIFSTYEKDAKKIFTAFLEMTKKDKAKEESIDFGSFDEITKFDKDWKKNGKPETFTDAQIRNAKHRLNKKASVAKRLEDKLFACNDRSVFKRKGISDNVRGLVEVDELKELSHFFISSKTADEQLVLIASGMLPGEGGEYKEAESEVKKKMHYAALDIMTEQIMNISVENIDLSKDEAIFDNFESLYELSGKLGAFRSFLEKEPEYLNDLKEQKSVIEYEKIQKRLGLLGAISDYFDARTLVLRHPVYLRNYDEEIGVIFNDEQSVQEKEFSKILLAMRSCAKRLCQILEKPASLKKFTNLKKKYNDFKAPYDSFTALYDEQESLNDPYDFKSFGRLTNYQRRQTTLRRSAYHKGGGIDYEDCKSDTLNRFLTDLSAFHTNNQSLTKQNVLADDQTLRRYLIDRRGNVVRPELAELFEMYRKLHTQDNDIDMKVFEEEGYLSKDELAELNASLAIGDKGIDKLTKQQQNLYFSSVASMLKMQFDLASRFLETYGCYEEQLPAPMFVALLTKQGRASQFSGRLRSAVKLFSLTEKSVVIDGRQKNLIDELVERNHIDADFADTVKGTAKLLDCYRDIVTGGVDSMVNLAVENSKQDKDEALQKISEEKYQRLHELTGYRQGHVLTLKQKRDQSVIIRTVPQQYKEFFEGFDKGRVLTSRGEYVKNLFILDNKLHGVEEGRRSEEYLNFRNSFSAISNLLAEIGKKKDANGKNLDPENVIVLRSLYNKAIKDAKNYLRGKRIDKAAEEGNNPKKARYAIADRIRQLMEKDYKKLLTLEYDKKYSIDEAFSDERYNDVKDVQVDKEKLSSLILADALGISKDKINLNELADNEADAIRQLSDIQVYSYILGKAKLPDAADKKGSLKAVPSPEEMLIIDEKTANRILNLEKNYLAYKFGSCINQATFTNIWNRIEVMKTQIIAANDKTGERNLQIITKEGFSDLSLTELSRAAGNAGLFADAQVQQRLKGVLKTHHNAGMAYRFECREQRVIIDSAPAAKNDEAFIDTVSRLSGLFDSNIGSLFNETNFSSAVYKEYGVKSIADLFYIDGKRALDVLSEKIDDYVRKMGDAIKGKPSFDMLPTIRDTAFKALILSDAAMKGKQVTLANFQVQSDGSVVPVVTDINLLQKKSGRNGAALALNDSDTIKKSRKDRDERFHKIRKDMYDRKNSAQEKIVKDICGKVQNKNGEIAFSRAANVFIDGDSNSHSDEFNTLKRALFKLYRTCRDPEKLELTVEEYPAFLKLYNAAGHYFAKHYCARVEKGNYTDALIIKRYLSRIAEKLSGMRLADQLEAPKNVTQKEKDLALENMGDFSKFYFRYTDYVCRDTIATESEKLEKRWQLLKTVERDIQILSTYHKEKVRSDTKLSYIVEEYKSIKLNMSLLGTAREKEGMKKALSNHRSEYITDKAFEISGSDRKNLEENRFTDVGITNEQMTQVRNIDQWVIRNFRNGGYARMFGYHTDRSNIVGELMKKSPRERLYIYYIVEHSQARKTPCAYDATQSQLYTPNLKTFKNSMIANRWKFYARFSGGYVYWHKLSQAMAICEGYGDVLYDMQDHFQKVTEEKEEKLIKGTGKNINTNTNAAKNAAPPSKDECDNLIDEYMKQLDPIMSALLRIHQLEDQRAELTEKEFNKQVQKAMDKLHVHAAKMEELPDIKPYALRDLKDKKIKSAAENKTGFEKGLAEAKEIGDKMQYVGKIGNLTDAMSSFGFMKGGFFDFMKGYGSASEKGIGSIGSVIGCAFTMRELLKNWKIIRNMDRTQNISGMFINITRLLQSVMSYTDAAQKAGTFAQGITSTAMGVALAAGDTCITGFKAWSHYRNGVRRIKASRLASYERQRDKTKYLETGEKTDTRYREGIVKLNRLIGKKQKIETGSSIVGTTASVFAAVTLFVTAISGGFATLPALVINLAASFGTIKWTSTISKNMRREVGAAYFEAEEMMKVARKDYLAENGQPLSKKQEEKLRKIILKRIAASHGYYSPSHMANAVAGNFANYLLKGAKQPGDEGVMCVNMIKGLGLKVTLNPRTREVVSPSASDIAKKMCG